MGKWESGKWVSGKVGEWEWERAGESGCWRIIYTSPGLGHGTHGTHGTHRTHGTHGTAPYGPIAPSHHAHACGSVDQPSPVNRHPSALRVTHREARHQEDEAGRTREWLRGRGYGSSYAPAYDDGNHRPETNERALRRYDDATRRRDTHPQGEPLICKLVYSATLPPSPAPTSERSARPRHGARLLPTAAILPHYHTAILSLTAVVPGLYIKSISRRNRKKRDRAFLFYSMKTNAQVV